MTISTIDLADAAELLSCIVQGDIDTDLRKPLMSFGGLFLGVPALAAAGRYMVQFAVGLVHDTAPASAHLASIQQFQA